MLLRHCEYRLDSTSVGARGCGRPVVFSVVRPCVTRRGRTKRWRGSRWAQVRNRSDPWKIPHLWPRGQPLSASWTRAAQPL